MQMKCQQGSRTKRCTPVKLWALIGGIVTLPLIPLLFLGEPLNEAAVLWQKQASNPLLMAGLLFCLLALDLFLPVPSSLISTVAGAQLGLVTGAIVTFTGLSTGAAIGFALARWAGPTLKESWLAERDAASLRKFADTWGAATLVVTRALPILAEAAVLLVGIQGLSWRRFWPPVLLANGGIAVAYAAFGQVAAEQEWLVVALAISAGLPLLLTIFARRWFRAKQAEDAA